MDRLIRLSEKSPFSNFDISKVIDCNLIRYEQLADYKTIDEIFRNDACIILQQQTRSYGHWVILTRHHNLIEYFCSYGSYPDELFDKFAYQKKYCDKYLSILLANYLAKGSGVLRYSPYRLQKSSLRTQTCGRWCAMRYFFKSIPIKQFAKLFINQKFPSDWYCSALTMFIG